MVPLNFLILLLNTCPSTVEIFLFPVEFRDPTIELADDIVE